MTVNDLIKDLQEIAEIGYGEKEIGVIGQGDVGPALLEPMTVIESTAKSVAIMSTYDETIYTEEGHSFIIE